MNWAHVHLLLNHVPVIGVAFGFFLLLLGVVRKSDELKRASLVVFVVVGALAVPTYLTGEPAEKIVRDLPGVSRALIEQHEDAAMFALISAGVLGLFSLGILLYFRAPKALPAWSTVAVLAISFWTCTVMARTAYLGGQIRHSEIRSGSPRAPSVGL
jgi:uncharacterized membrane protein